ncbi:MAG: hypothetical protein MUD08_03755 [Cytophagales bacterium]|nr:hypothetical protein [Cytophagales bacterium]
MLQNETIRITIKSPTLIQPLVWVAVGLSFLSFLRQVYLFEAGRPEHGFGFRLWKLFDIDGENTIPAYFSTLLLLTSAVLLFLIFYVKRKGFKPVHYQGHWLGMSVVFLYLSADEALSLHENLIGITQKIAGSNTGIFSLAWVIPFGLFVVFFATAYLRFLWHLSAKVRLQFILAGIVYVSGALGMEVVGGYYIEKNGWTLTTHFLLTVEELLEMLGIIIFIRILLGYISEELPDFMFHLQTRVSAKTTNHLLKH